jgi:hypothetical protein
MTVANQSVQVDSDLNRYLPELDKTVPVLDGKTKVPRVPLDYVSPRHLEAQLASVMEAVRQQNPQADHIKNDLDSHMRSLLDSRDNYDDRAKMLDATKGYKGGFTQVAGSIGMFLLDIGAFTFTFYALIDAVRSGERPAPEVTEILQMAVPLAIMASVMIKIISGGVADFRKAIYPYIAVWSLFAMADISYLLRRGIANVGVAMTAFLMGTCLANFFQAKKHATGKSRPDDLKLYGRAYDNYQLKLHQWKHAIIRLRQEPKSGVDDILHRDVFDFGQ